MAIFVPYKPPAAKRQNPATEQMQGAAPQQAQPPAARHARHAHGPAETVLAHWSRCPHCYISISTVGTEPPSVCPYCNRALDQTEETRPLAEEVAPPSEEEVKRRIGNIYHRPHLIVAGIIGAIATLILGWAVTEQLRSISGFWYKEFLVASYSIVAGLFVLTRFIFAAFYRAPRDVGFEPTVTVLVPCFNEGEAIRKTIERIFSSGYPEEKLEVVCVNDGSKDDSLAHMLAAQTRHPHLVVVNFEKNRGLCHGWGVGTFLARGEFMVCVDSDTFVFPGSLHKLMQGFVDPSVGGISGHCDIENADVNTLTRLQDVRYYFSYKIMKAAESIFGVVSCLPGCFSAYRRTCVLAVMDKWINATVWGEHGNFADDRSLTNQILRDYKIIYDDEALATTICPETWRQYIRQQARWERSYLREIWKTGKFIWRKHPVPALSWYAMMWMPLVEPFVMLEALIVIPVKAYLSAPKIYSSNLASWAAGKAAAIQNGVSFSGGFMSSVADKLGYSILRAAVSWETIVASALLLATFIQFRRENRNPARSRIAGAILASLCFAAFAFRAAGILSDIPMLMSTVTYEYIATIMMSSTALGALLAIAGVAAAFVETFHGTRRKTGWGLTFLYILFFIWKVAAVMPPNLAPGNVSMPLYAFSEAMLIPRTFMIGVMSITAVWSLHFLATTGRRWWKAGFAFTLSYILFFSWQIYWALYTIRGKAWGTRG
ncbi:MAG: glycosyltransferase [Kiritimatiellae bacterium]|nr:glycosyltransferase [Kiritimatiellia bacterium]